MRWLLLVAILFFSNSLISKSQAEPAQGSEHVLISNHFEKYRGSLIAKINVLDLKRTADKAARMLLGGREGDLFDPDKWTFGIRKLYNTQDLFDITTDIREAPRLPETPSTQASSIIIDVHIKDKWTLLPDMYLQNGGGSSFYGVGIVDTNLGGYFTNANLSYATFNGAVFYDINLFQEFFLDTDLMMGLDVSKQGNPVSIQNLDGKVTQDLLWNRHQYSALFGSRFGTKIRFYSNFTLFKDSILNQKPITTAEVIQHTQYRLKPIFIHGRSNFTNVLEEGQELTVTPTFTNFLEAASRYSQLVMSFKKTIILPGDANLAAFVGTGIMSNTSVLYQFRLGGFDTVRGFSTNRAVGLKYVNWSLEYRPLLFTTRLPLLDLAALQACFFTDGGIMQDHYGERRSLTSAGIGLRTNLAALVGAIVRFDLAKTITPSEGYGFSFALGQFF
jgi:outer membrane protein assembly factor BamA